jgi:hypothetical protein
MSFAGRDGGGRGRGRGRGLPRGAGNFMTRGRGGRGGYGENGGGRPEYGSQQHQDYVSIPASKCGLVIGKGGETIKNINQVRSPFYLMIICCVVGEVLNIVRLFYMSDDFVFVFPSIASV